MWSQYDLCPQRLLCLKISIKLSLGLAILKKIKKVLSSSLAACTRNSSKVNYHFFFVAPDRNTEGPKSWDVSNYFGK